MKLLYDKALSFFYDDITRSGYYDYNKEVKLIKKILGSRKTLLELGSGTGNLLIPLAKAGFKVTGIDNSPHMIKLLGAKAHKENLRIHNYLTDQRKLSLKKKFDGIISSGGFVWFATFDKKIYICTYSSSFEDIIKTFKNTYDHLNKNGLCLINIQHHGRKFALKLKNGMDYHFEIKQKSPSKIIKTHFIEKEGKLIFKRASPQRIFSEERAVQIAEKVGFKVFGPDESETFYVFEIGRASC